MNDLHAAEKAEMRPLREKRHELASKLEGQIKNKAGDADIKTTLDELSANHASSEEVEDKFHKSSLPILTPTQQARMMLHRMKEHEEKERKEKGEKEGDEE